MDMSKLKVVEGFVTKAMVLQSNYTDGHRGVRCLKEALKEYSVEPSRVEWGDDQGTAYFREGQIKYQSFDEQNRPIDMKEAYNQKIIFKQIT